MRRVTARFLSRESTSVLSKSHMTARTGDRIRAVCRVDGRRESVERGSRKKRSGWAGRRQAYPPRGLAEVMGQQRLSPFGRGRGGSDVGEPDHQDLPEGAPRGEPHAYPKDLVHPAGCNHRPLFQSLGATPGRPAPRPFRCCLPRWNSRCVPIAAGSAQVAMNYIDTASN